MPWWERLFHEYTSRAVCMGNDPYIIFPTIVGDALGLFTGLILGLLFFKRRKQGIINWAMAVYLFCLASVHISLIVCMWHGFYGIHAVIKIIYGISSILVIGFLPHALTQNKIEKRLIQEMKDKITEMEKLKNDLARS